MNDQNNGIRANSNSLFTKPLRIPYVTKEMEHSTDEVNSFVTHDPLYSNQPMRNRQDSNSNKIYYTIGSLD